MGPYLGFFSMGVGAHTARRNMLGMRLRAFCPKTRVCCAARNRRPSVRTGLCGHPFPLSNACSLGTTTFIGNGRVNGIARGRLCGGLVDKGGCRVVPRPGNVGNSVLKRGSVLNTSAIALKLAGKGHKGGTSSAP